MCKRGRVSQEDDSDQPFRKFMREKYPIKNFKIAKCKYAKIRSFQKGDHSNEDRKSHSMLRRDIQEDFVKKEHP